MVLRLAGNETKKYEEDGSWIELRASISKGIMNTLISNMPQVMLAAAMNGKQAEAGTITLAETNRTTESLFEALLVSWSLPVEPTLDNYFNLDSDSAAWVDRTLYEHFNSLSLSKDEQGKP